MAKDRLWFSLSVCAYPELDKMVSALLKMSIASSSDHAWWGYVWNGESKKGQEVFVEARGLGLELNEFSLTSVLGALFDVKEGEQIHDFSVKMGLFSGCSTNLNNAVMTMYYRRGSRLDAVKVFDEMTNPDVVSSAPDDSVEALELFKILCCRDAEVNEYTLIIILAATGDPKLLKSGKQIQASCQKTGYMTVTSVSNVLICMYGKYGLMNDARQVYDEIVSRDIVSWNSMIAGYSENGLVSSALAMLSQMRDKYTMASILEVVSNLNSPSRLQA